MTTRRGVPPPAEAARQRAEQQRREIEAAAPAEPEGRAPLQAAVPDQLFAGRTCSEHSGRAVDGRTGRCPLCGLSPIHALRASLFDDTAPPTTRLI
jgi:hypothetical protein